MKKIIFLFFLCLVFMSCDPFSSIRYHVINKTSNTIKIIEQIQISIDTFYVLQNQDTVIMSKGGIGLLENFKEKNDTINDVIFFEIYKNDTLKSNSDFRKTSRWVFEKTGRFSGKNTLTVQNTDF